MRPLNRDSNDCGLQISDCGIDTTPHLNLIRNPQSSIRILAAVLLLTSPLAALDISTPEDKILSKGFSAYMDGNDKRAQAYFEEVIRLNPKNEAAKKGLEKVKVRLRKAEDKEKAKRKALADAKYREGKTLMKTADVVSAIDAFHETIDAVPDHSGARDYLTSIKKKMNKEAKRKELNLSTWAFARGVLAYLERDWAKAWRIWSERLQLEPGNIALANATKRAENNFRRMMVKEREEFFRRSARAFYEQGLYAQSIESWKSVLAMKTEDLEGLEGKARAEEALLRAQGKGRDNQIHDLLEEGLEYYAAQEWKKSLDAFQRLTQLDSEFTTAKEYIAKLNRHLESPVYKPVSVQEATQNFRPRRPSNTGETVEVPKKFENYVESRKELQAQLNRDPSNLRAQQELDKIVKAQEDESERIYKDGLIAYSQGNRPLAIQYWKQVLVIHPDHKKASAALKKARAEEERAVDGGGQP